MVAGHNVFQLMLTVTCMPLYKISMDNYVITLNFATTNVVFTWYHLCALPNFMSLSKVSFSFSVGCSSYMSKRLNTNRAVNTYRLTLTLIYLILSIVWTA